MPTPASTGLETHVVLTVRDLSRQVTSEWQERVKNGSVSPFRRFQRRIERQLDREDLTASFWRFQHITGILDRWAAELPPERVHIVVAPRGRATPDLLWRRFGDAVGFDGSQFDPTTTGGPTNQTLGSTQVAVLRRVNKALDGRVRQPHYARVVKDYFAQHLLASQPGTKPTCPPDLVDRLRGFAQAQNDEIAARGYRVYGDLADLVPEVASEAVPPTRRGGRRGAARGLRPGDRRPARRPRRAPRRPARRAPTERRRRRRLRLVGDAGASPPAACERLSAVTNVPSRPRARVFVHVGSPKTGTTFLQNVLWTQRALAREQGLLLPHGAVPRPLPRLARRPRLSRLSGPPRRGPSGMWDRVVAESVAWGGNVLISHELFAAANPQQASPGGRVAAARRQEVHVVLTVRDLVRQLTAEWQEHVKHRSTKTLEQFVTDVRNDTERTGWFWKVQDFDPVLERWGAGLPPERVHVITVPPRRHLVRRAVGPVRHPPRPGSEQLLARTCRGPTPRSGSSRPSCSGASTRRWATGCRSPVRTRPSSRTSWRTASSSSARGPA